MVWKRRTTIINGTKTNHFLTKTVLKSLFALYACSFCIIYSIIYLRYFETHQAAAGVSEQSSQFVAKG